MNNIKNKKILLNFFFYTLIIGQVITPIQINALMFTGENLLEPRNRSVLNASGNVTQSIVDANRPVTDINSQAVNYNNTSVETPPLVEVNSDAQAQGESNTSQPFDYGAYQQTSQSISNTINNFGAPQAGPNDLDGDGIRDTIDRDGGRGTNNDDKPNVAGKFSGVSTLYPNGVPGDFNIESFGVDFASCVAGLMAAEALKSGINVLDMLSRTIGNAISDVIKGASQLPFFAAIGLTGKLLGTGNETIETEQEVDESGVDLLKIKMIPASDSIAFCLRNVFIAKLTGSISKWIDSGANKAAIYVEDFETVLNDIAQLSFEQAIGEVNVCANIRSSVDVSALTSWLKMNRGEVISNRCTLVFDREYDLMLRGGAFNLRDFEELAANPNNNILGATLLVNSAAESKNEILEKKYSAELGWTKGFWNWTDDSGKITSPGEMVTQNVLDKLKLPSDNLLLTDDYDQIMLMISNQLIKKIINDGLF